MSAPAASPETEIDALAGRYGRPVRLRVDLQVSGLVKALNARPSRMAEVVFAIVRPGGKVLLHTKSFYPPGGWRVPSGSIEAGEGIERALWREVAEETSLKTEITRFVAVIDYDIALSGSRRSFRSYVFLLREVGGSLHTVDAGERVTAFREVAPAELPAVADTLETLGASVDPAVAAWGDWGRYRAIAHRLLWEALRQDGGEKAEIPGNGGIHDQADR